MSACPRPVTIEDLIAAVRLQQARLPALAWRPPDAPGCLALAVHSAHPGAGASTVAVALTAALDDRGEVDSTLVDLATDDDLGATEAIQVRADLGLLGWSGGRRGGARIVRPVESPKGTDHLVGNVVIDARDRGRNFDLDVLVCRATVPSVGRAESILMEDRARVIAVVGASKWPPAVRSSLGPQLDAARSSGGVVFFPHEAALEVNGLSAEPLPTSTIRAAGRLLDLLGHGQPTAARAD